MAAMLCAAVSRKGMQEMGIADDMRNKADDLKGRAKEAAGAATGNN